MKYMIIAGEASGDLHASHLIASIRKNDPAAEFRFFGGDLMATAARRNPDLHYDQMNVMGFSEVLRKLPQLLRNLRKAKTIIKEWRPDALILIDYPSFNLRLAKFAHKEGIPVHYYISPKVWAWKEWRVKSIRKYVDHLYSILPFEVDFYRKHGYEVKYVGNPSVQEIAHSLGHIPPKRHFMERQGLHDDRPIIALLPGSRKSELRNNLPLMIAAMKHYPDYQYVVAAAPAISEKFYREVAQDPGLKLVFGSTHTLLKYSQAAVVTSGTATLETALIGTPQVVVYRANGMKLSYKIMEKLLKVKYVSLPNLVMGRSIVPELLVHQCTEAAIVRELTPLLQPSPRRDWQLGGYKSMVRRLGNSVAADYAGELIVESLKGKMQQAAPASASAGDGEAPKRPYRPHRRYRPRQQQSQEQPQNQTKPREQQPQQERPQQPRQRQNQPRRERPQQQQQTPQPTQQPESQQQQPVSKHRRRRYYRHNPKQQQTEQ